MTPLPDYCRAMIGQLDSEWGVVGHPEWESAACSSRHQTRQNAHERVWLMRIGLHTHSGASAMRDRPNVESIEPGASPASPRTIRAASTGRPLGLAALIAAGAAALLPARMAAQQTQLDLHGNYAVGTDTHAKSWGGGAGVQTTFGSKTDPINLSAAPSLDYLKQEQGGPSQTTLSLDLDVQPGGSGTVTPYAGLSAGANWSGGSAKQWEGARLGLETLAGAQVKLGGSHVSAKGEERFGYVKGQEHTLTTRLGVLVSF
jgi:hypothetical protein